jgi:molecular chaperone GrpE
MSFLTTWQTVCLLYLCNSKPRRGDELYDLFHEPRQFYSMEEKMNQQENTQHSAETNDPSSPAQPFGESTNSGESSTMDINADADVAGTSHLEDPVEESTELEKLQAELAEMKDKYLRQVADFDNFRRRSAKERMELIQTAGKEVITEMLEVLDDCDRALEQFPQQQDVNAIKEGVQLIFSKFRNKLISKGLKPMETKGTEFNADEQEAITEIPAPSPDLVGKVVDEVQKGYYLNEKIIRFAKVVVGK